MDNTKKITIAFRSPEFPVLFIDNNKLTPGFMLKKWTKKNNIEFIV